MFKKRKNDFIMVAIENAEKFLKGRSRENLLTLIFFIKLLLQLGYELLLSEMQKNWGVTDFVSKIRYLKGHPNFKKSVFLTRWGSNVCMSTNIANESLEQKFLCQIL